MNHTIELRKVSKYYANESGVSMGFARADLTLDMGEFVAITGESGSGKSTLLNVISGLDTYDEGEMFVCGEDTTAYQTADYERYRKTYIGNIFQDYNLINSYTVYQNIELVMLMCGKKASECKQRINELIELVGLTEYKRAKASRLSGGQKQRVAIARALAKDAPIIVADEPTGNLDSESANLVMETLSRVSKDKLVVIVTHNYEQAEPYVTRKLTMHDGRIIEDKNFGANVMTAADVNEGAESAEDDIVQEAQAEYRGGRRSDDMRKTSELKLGVRNTFNLPAKFILLFVVYFFVSTAVLSQYASAKNNQHSTDILGYNQYFSDTRAERMIVTKNDRSVMTDEDFEVIKKTDNIKNIVTNDMGVDQQLQFQMTDYIIDAVIYPMDQIEGTKPTYGRMPEADNEILLYCDNSSVDFEYIKSLKEGALNQAMSVTSYDDATVPMIDDKLTIVGVIVDEDSSQVNLTGSCKIYMTAAENNKLRPRQLAYLCRTKFNFDGTTTTYEGGLWVLPSSHVAQGKAYISEDIGTIYASETITGKPLSINISNSFFSDSLGLTVGKVFTKKNIADNLGYNKESYDRYSNVVFISVSDYNRLYDKGSYQVSAYMADETADKATIASLEKAGYKAFTVKDSLTDITGGFSFVLKLLSYGSMIIEFIVLFFIAYAVIRLIMKSRNSYYSTLRILGANKHNTDMVLRIELLLMMAIAYAVDIVFVLLLKNDIIHIGSLKSKLNFLEPLDYVLLLVVLLVISLLIAKRYSRKIFTKSAMTAYRGEV